MIILSQFNTEYIAYIWYFLALILASKTAHMQVLHTVPDCSIQFGLFILFFALRLI